MKKTQIFTNMELFFLFIAIICGVLGIGYGSLILGGICVFAGFLAMVSIIKRKKQAYE